MIDLRDLMPVLPEIDEATLKKATDALARMSADMWVQNYGYFVELHSGVLPPRFEKFSTEFEARMFAAGGRGTYAGYGVMGLDAYNRPAFHKMTERP